MKPLKIALLCSDNREPFRQYENPVPWFGTAPEALMQGFADLAGEVEVHVVTCAQRPMISSPEKLAENIYFHSLHVPNIGWLKTSYQGCIRAIRRKLREIGPDLVHGQGTERECALSAVFSGYPNVVTIHGNMRLVAKINHARPFTFDWLAARLEAFAIPRTDGVVCITNYTRQAVAGDGVRTWLLPNAVDKNFFPIVPESRPQPVILCVGHITVRKNQNAFIHAMDRLAERSAIRLVFVGLAAEGDPYAQEFKKLIAVRPWIEHINWAERPEVREHFKRASVLVLPTLEDNCPMVVLEAMAAGIPVVASNVGGVPDLVEDGQTGLFCDPLDEVSMANAVMRILDDPNLARLLTANARKQARDTYFPEVVARRHLEIYWEVLGRDSVRQGKELSHAAGET